MRSEVELMSRRSPGPRRAMARAAGACLLWACGSAAIAQAPLGRGSIAITSLSVDVDTRPDLDGLQYTLTAVKDFPSAVQTVVGLPESRRAGFSVSARLTGPGLGSQALTFLAPAGGRFEI